MIRSFRARDLVELYQLDQICFSPEIAYSRNELKYFLVHPHCSCWVAEQASGKLAGFVIIERVYRDGRPGGHIITLDVDPAERRQGLGKQLMHIAEEQMRQEGAGMLRLEVAENNAAARQFYRSLGFLPSGKIAKYYGGRVDAEVMEKAIGGSEI